MTTWRMWRTPIPGRFQVDTDIKRLEEIRKKLNDRYWPGGDSLDCRAMDSVIRRWKLLSWVIYRLEAQGKAVHPKICAALERARRTARFWSYIPYEDLMLWDIGEEK
jgi:hypothetical protein